MDVDGEDEEMMVLSQKRKRSKAAQAKFKKAKQKKNDGSGNDEEEDTYTAFSKSLWSNGTSKPPVGSFENCTVCEKQFTVVCYTFLCTFLFIFRNAVNKTNFRLNTPWLQTLAQVFSATHAQKQVEMILSRNLLLRKNARRQRTKGTSLPLMKRGPLRSFRSVSRLAKVPPLHDSMLNE